MLACPRTASHLHWQVDILTVLKSQGRLWQVAARKVAALDPPPALALFGGDLVHDGLVPTASLATLLDGPINGFHIARALLAQFRMALVFATGNHDYHVVCGDTAASAPRSVSRRLFKRLFGAEEYTAVNAGGWKLLVLNSQLGHTWDADHPGCNTK